MVVEEDKIKKLTAIIHSFVTANEDQVCVIHCTHGFNRTGLVVCSYYCEYLGMTIDEAFAHFKKHRPNVGCKYRIFSNVLLVGNLPTKY